MFGKKKPMSKTEAGTPPSADAELTPEQIEELKTRAAKADENWDRLLRTTADFDNFKKRAAREKIESAHYASVALLQKLLPVLDNFEMALAAAQTAQGDKLASLSTGVTMIQQQLKNALTETGLEEIESAGQPFDPNLHEAVSPLETARIPAGRSEEHTCELQSRQYLVCRLLLEKKKISNKQRLSYHDETTRDTCR